MLAAPEVFQPWFGRSSVTVVELAEVSGLSAGMFFHFVDDACCFQTDEALYSVTAMWPTVLAGRLRSLRFDPCSVAATLVSQKIPP